MDTWALVDGLFFLQRPTRKPNQQNSPRPLEGNYFGGTFGGVAWRAQARYFFNQKKKKILLSSMEKGRFCVSCNRHICWVPYKEVGHIVCGSRLLVRPGTGYTPSKRKYVGLENIPFYDILMCKSRSERMVHCYYFTPFLRLHG